MSFPSKINAVLLAGGNIKHLPDNEEKVPSKGHMLINGRPMAARTLQALLECSAIDKVSLVTPEQKDNLGPQWQGVDFVKPAGDKLISSLVSGIEPFIENENDPVMLVAGDLPFLTAPAVDNFVELCRQRSQGSLWYGFVEKEASLKKYPQVRHTWVRMAESTYCGSGIVVIRPQILKRMQEIFALITKARKNPFALAKLMSLSTMFRLLTHRLSVPMAEEAAGKLLETTCCGILSPYPETSYNVDDGESLQQARRDAEDIDNHKP